MALVTGFNVVSLAALQDAFTALNLNNLPSGMVTGVIHKQEEKTEIMLMTGTSESRLHVTLTVKKEMEMDVITWLNKAGIKHFEADDVYVSDGSDLVHVF